LSAAANTARLGRVSAKRPSKTRPPGDYEIRIIGAPRAPLRDFYHLLLRLSWTRTLLLVAVAYFGLNALFALGYSWVGGITHARPGSFADDFFFSVQTMGTIGYGTMAPETDGANLLVVLESTLSLVSTALVTGLVFAKFSRPSARLMFSQQVAIGPMNGVPTLAFRVGNQRSNLIVEAEFRVALVRTEITREGKVFYRSIDLHLTRSRALSLSRAWTVLHTVDESSPLFGETPETLVAADAELLITVMGIDDTWMQSVHSSHRYFAADIAWGAEHADILSEAGDVMTLDLRNFHRLQATAPSERFPYPRSAERAEDALPRSDAQPAEAARPPVVGGSRLSGGASGSD
jgi:inward rectifier potassium channel